MSNRSSRPARIDLRGWALPIAFVTLWFTATQLHWVNTRLIVPPQGVLEAAAKELQQGSFYEGLFKSLVRDLSGFALGAITGVLLGTWIGVSRLANQVIGPTFHTLRQISLFAWLPLLSAILGTGEGAKILFIGFSTFYPVVLGTVEGVRGVTRAQAEVARVYRFTAWQTLHRLVWPAASPQILGGLRLGLIYAWLATIGAEFLLVNDGHGIGNIVFKGSNSFNVELILFGLIAIGAVGVAFNHLASRAEQRLLHWRGPQHR